LPSVTIGEWRGKEAGANVTPDNAAIGWPAVVDSCPQIELTWEKNLVEESGQHQIFQITYTATDYALSRNSAIARQQVTVDKTTFAATPGVENETLTVYPNPAANTLHVRFTNSATIATAVFKLFTLDGRPVQNFKEKEIRENTALNIVHLAPGMYILQVSAGNTVLQKTFVKK